MFSDIGTWKSTQPTGGKAPKQKSKDLEDFTPSHLFAPRVTVIGGGPKGMPLVYHICSDGNEVCSPCFFNKNIFAYSKTEKLLNNDKSKKLLECETRSNIAKHLKKLNTRMRRNCNYYSGTFDVDYYRDEGLKVVPWSITEPMKSIPKYNYSMPKSNITKIEYMENDLSSLEDNMEDFSLDLENSLLQLEEENGGNEPDYKEYANKQHQQGMETRMKIDGEDDESESDTEDDISNEDTGDVITSESDESSSEEE